MLFKDSQVFDVRDNYLNDSNQIARQISIYKCLVKKPETYNNVFVKKVMAILQPLNINYITVAKILNNFDLFSKINENLTIEEKQQYNNILKNIDIKTLKEFFIPHRSLSIAKKSKDLTIIQSKSYDLSDVPKTNLFQFEKLVFDNKVIYPLSLADNFSDYIYSNLLHSLESTQKKEKSWQTKFLEMIQKWGKCKLILIKDAFEKDSITFNGNKYDVSFVPKFNLNLLIPYEKVFIESDDEIAQNKEYRNNLDVKHTKIINRKYLDIFVIFPFKDQHFVSNDGKIYFIEKVITQNDDLISKINQICVCIEFEQLLRESIHSISFDELISFVLTENSLKLQGIGLLLLREMCGDNLMLNDHIIKLPYLFDILKYTSFPCSKTQILLYKNPNEHLSDSLFESCIKLIKDITYSSSTAFDVSLLSSDFFIPASYIEKIFCFLKNNEEKYVFLTLVLQRYNNFNFSQYRNNLQVNFHHAIQEFVKVEHTPMIQNINNIVYENRVLNLLPASLCYDWFPDSSVSFYQFNNEQLNDLVEKNETIFTKPQMAIFFTLLLEH